jgi:hypothetical protein
MRCVWMAGVCLLGLCTPAQAQVPSDHDRTTGLRHVRGTSPAVGRLIAETAEQSPAFQALLDRLEASTVIVYVRTASLPTLSIEGRTAFLKRETPAPDLRILVVELSCSRPLLSQSAILAHELRHALEIADAPWVVDPPTLERYYERIGMRLDSNSWPVRFETMAAREAAAQVRRELASPAGLRARGEAERRRH